MTKLDDSYFFDRELSWIDFNRRVLSEGMDEMNPLLERLKFLGIVSSNFDEFFMVRLAGLNDQDSLTRTVYEKAFQTVRIQEQYFDSRIILELAEQGIKRLRPEELSERQREYLKNLFTNELLPLLTPIAVHPGESKLSIVNLSLYRVVELQDPKDSKVKHYALIEIPRNYSRMIALSDVQGYAFILLEDVVRMFANVLFQGYEILDIGLMRLTRAAEMSLDEEKDEDFAKVMSEALRERKANFFVRLEIEGNDDIVQFIQSHFNIPEFKIFKNQSWMDLKTISQLAFSPAYENLKRPKWVPRSHGELESAEDIWELIQEKDILIHHPYESFDSFLRFISEAAEDADVLAIKQTLYRAGENSEVIRALEKAAEYGKQVTVLVELKARFDEQKNIEGARRLVQAGATVIYGVVGLKTHAKACLVVRREPEGIQRYVHLGTGNYNEKTAKFYSDLSFFSSREDLTMDVSSFFNIITGYSNPVGFSKIEIAPYGLRRRLERLILRESMRTNKEHPGMILAKLNSLVDRDIIDALYRASQAGVQIKLNIRGICCLKPGVPGLSENIEVVSIVDMFLEHSRIFYFDNGGDEEVFLSSADWMPRNLDRRLEIMFPIEDGRIKNQLISLLNDYFRDHVKSWQLGPDGEYRKKEKTGKDESFRIQDYLCQKAIESEKTYASPRWKDLKPQMPKNVKIFPPNA